MTALRTNCSTLWQQIILRLYFLPHKLIGRQRKSVHVDLDFVDLGTLYTSNSGKRSERKPLTPGFSLSRLLNVLEVVAPFKHFNKLREFVQMKLPPGFPVKLGTCVFCGCNCVSVCQWARWESKVNVPICPSRHPGFPHHHRHRHISGIPL